MILFKKIPFQFKMRNIMMLDVEVEEDGQKLDAVVYLSKNTYDQCVRLHSRFDGEVGFLSRNVGVDCTEGTVTKWFADNAPEPLNMLAPFLGILANKHDIEEGNMEQMLGYLHILSQMINFDGYVLMPQQARADMTVGKAVLRSYKESWDDLERDLLDLVPNRQVEELKELLSSLSIGVMAVGEVQSASKEGDYKHPKIEDVEDPFSVEVESDEDWTAMMDEIFEKAEAAAKAELAADDKLPESVTSVVPSTVPVSQDMSDKEKREEEIKKENDAIADEMSRFV